MVVSLAPFVPSHHEVVRKMLELAAVTSDDVVFDLGCGDGRVLFSAVNEFVVKQAVGYELRKDLYAKLSDRVTRQGLDGRVTVVNDDLLNADISDATVIMLYLTATGNRKLTPKLAREARSGTRVVSHDFSFPDWRHARKEDYQNHALYLYRLPDALKKRSLFHRR